RARARKSNRFQMIKGVNYAGGNLGGNDKEDAAVCQNADAQMASSDASPDVEPEADSAGSVQRRAAPGVGRAVPVAAPAPRNFFQRLFGIRHQPAPAPTPPPPIRRRGTDR